MELLSTDDYKVIKGKYGPMLICGNKRIGIPKSIDAENIDEKIAKELLSYPKLLGQHKEKDIIVNMGGNGRYIKYNNKGEDIVMNLEKMGDVTLETIVKKIEERTKNVIMVIGKDLKVMNGKYGPYMIYKKKIYKIPSDYIEKIDSLTKNELMKIVKNTPKKKYIKKDIKK